MTRNEHQKNCIVDHVGAHRRFNRPQPRTHHKRSARQIYYHIQVSEGVVAESGGLVVKPTQAEQSLLHVSERGPPPTGQYTCSGGQPAAPPTTQSGV